METKNSTCEKHGEYEALQIFGFWSSCPRCQGISSDEVVVSTDQIERLRKVLMKRSRIPSRYQGCSFSEYRSNNPGQIKAKEICEQYASNFADNAKHGRCLAMIGRPGTGKTHLAAAIIRELVKSSVRSLYVSTYEIFSMVRANQLSIGEDASIEAFTDCDLLVIDELGVKSMTEWELSILFRVINDRYNKYKPVIVISNLPPAGFKTYVGERIFDRIRDSNGVSITFDWDSYRGQR